MSQTPPLVPLTGLQVLEFGHYIAGPAAAMMLTDFGANVTNIPLPSATINGQSDIQPTLFPKAERLYLKQHFPIDHHS